MKLIISIFALLVTGNSFGASLVCGDVDSHAAPYFTFILNFENGLSDPNKLSINVVPSAFFGSEELVVESPVNGCQNLNLTESGVSVSFECDADGDAGYGSVDLYTEGTSVLGSITFPEGTDLGQYRVHEDTKIEFSCPITL